MELGSKRKTPQKATADVRHTKRTRRSPTRTVTVRASLESLKPAKPSVNACATCRRSAVYASSSLVSCAVCESCNCSICMRTCGGQGEGDDRLGCGRRVCSKCCSGETTDKLGLELCRGCQGKIEAQNTNEAMEPS